jgi:hypothetical protein
VLYVHVLTFADVATTVAEVADLERRVLRAFGTADEVARICGPATTGEPLDGSPPSEVHRT